MSRIAIVVVAIVALCLGPFAIIWALNTLFHLGIAYGLREWAAALILGALVGTTPNSGSRS